MMLADTQPTVFACLEDGHYSRAQDWLRGQVNLLRAGHIDDLKRMAAQAASAAVLLVQDSKMVRGTLPQDLASLLCCPVCVALSEGASMEDAAMWLAAGADEAVDLCDENSALVQRERLVRLVGAQTRSTWHRLGLDAQTGAHCATMFWRRIAIDTAHTARAQAPMSLILLDLVDWGRKDLSGQRADAGAVLQQAAAIARDIAKRATDSVYRVDTLQLAMVLPYTHAHGARHLAQIWYQELCASFEDERLLRHGAYCAAVTASNGRHTDGHCLHARATAVLHWCRELGRPVLHLDDLR